METYHNYLSQRYFDSRSAGRRNVQAAKTLCATASIQIERVKRKDGNSTGYRFVNVSLKDNAPTFNRDQLLEIWQNLGEFLKNEKQA